MSLTMRSAAPAVLAFALVGLAAVPGVWAKKADPSEVKAVANQYLDFIITVPQTDKESVVKAVRGLAGLFDFENMEGPRSVTELVLKYNRLVADELTAPEDSKEWYQSAKQGVRDLFFSSYIQNYRKARLEGVGRLRREDVSVIEVTFSEDAQSAMVVLKDRLGTSKLKLRKGGERWLIYAIESDHTKPAP